jgi:hypothetical protein
MGFKKGWRAYKATKRGSTKRKRSPTKTRKRRVRRVAKKKNYRKKALSLTSGMGPKSLMMDLAWSFAGYNLLGRTPLALPTTHIVQGLAAHAFGIPGRRRLIYAALDYCAIYLSAGRNGNGNMLAALQPILNPLRQFAKMRPA